MLAARAVVRPLQRGLASRAPGATRSIHLPPPLPRPGLAGHTLFSRVQFLLNSALRGFNTYARGVPLVAKTASRQLPRSSFGSSLSLPARVALSRPLGGTPFMPKPVAVQRSMQQVGLGTARTFATTRPIFSNIVENVPIAGRALLEADFDFKTAPGQRLRIAKEQKKSQKKSSKSKAKPRTTTSIVEEHEKLDAEALAQYFKAAPEASVVSYLDIPLAPTPSGRMPLAEHPLPGPPMAPLLQLAEAHATHSKHAIRVASLFRRLDAAKVWQKGAAMEAFGDRTGLCTVLRVKFSGWTKKEVQDIIGDGGRGWSTLMQASTATTRWVDEVYRSIDEDSILLSDPASPWLRDDRPLMQMSDCITEADMAASSLVMPTLDFSANFVSSRSSESSFVDTTTPASFVSSRSSESGWAEHVSVSPVSEPTERWSESDEDDVLSLSDGEGSESLASVWATDSVHSASSGVGFSSEHWRRVSTVIGDF